MDLKIKLREIIWEITRKCNNCCSYCGSKEGWKEDINEDTIKLIADRISGYLPSELNISGGDPLLVSYNTHKYIKNKLKNVICKILINPLSYTKAKREIIDLYDPVGVSINTNEEINKFHFEFTPGNIKNKFTIITNFNITNFFLFDKIAEIVEYGNFIWQIQFTIYKGKSLFALYEYPEAIAKLNEYIEKYSHLKIIFADNANDSPCSAGLSTIGLLSNGDILPCLSMRSWCDVVDIIEGNILVDPLKDIWVNKFKTNRFEPCICCKDICLNQKLKYPEKKPINLEKEKSYEDITGPVYGVSYPIPSTFKPIQPPPYQVVVYGVSTSFGPNSKQPDFGTITTNTPTTVGWQQTTHLNSNEDYTLFKDEEKEKEVEKEKPVGDL